MCVAGTTSSEHDEERWYLFGFLLDLTMFWLSVCIGGPTVKNLVKSFTSTRV